jgi:aerobic-type carbon monoxide dehydrogenase small subunit (CoxS/CutS family)
MTTSNWTIRVNGRRHKVTADGDTPLLYVLQNDLALKGPRFGCGLAQCGACSVLLDNREIRACITPISAVADKSITTVEGIAAWHARQARLPRSPAMHPVQQALIDEQAPQCGYCMNGIVVKAAELLANNPKPTEEQIKEAMNGHLCRCGAYPSIVRAIQQAAAK